MKFYFEAYATLEAENLQDACRQISEQFIRIAADDWKNTDPTNDGIFKHGHVSLDTALTGLETTEFKNERKKNTDA